MATVVPCTMPVVLREELVEREVEPRGELAEAREHALAWSPGIDGVFRKVSAAFLVDARRYP